MTRPFVVTIASEKGGVGKTTIATNLAVYLKALHEDLPVTIASFDNHFSVDQMFALGSSSGASVASLLGEDWRPETVMLGQYGVQYLTSERRLASPEHQPGWLRQRLHASGLEGILVLDTRPILDWFTEAALLAADLVLTPVKDRAALVNAGALRQVLCEVDREQLHWLVPSLVDTRARLNAEVRVHEFLRYAAGERDFQVLGLQISKSPKVESLSSGFSSRIQPVLTHARQTAVHGQLRQLAEFVLERYDSGSAPVDTGRGGGFELEGLPVAAERYLIPECPGCGRQATNETGHLFFDLRSRRRGLVHPDCFAPVYSGLELSSLDQEGGLIGLVVDGPGLVGPEPRLTAHLFDTEGNLHVSESVELQGEQGYAPLLATATGRPIDQAYRELVLIAVTPGAPVQLLTGAKYQEFKMARRKAMRELRGAGFF